MIVWTMIVRWLSKIIVTKWIKAQFFVHRFILMYFLILEGVPEKKIGAHPEKNGSPVYMK